jgi:hypothetical protein
MGWRGTFRSLAATGRRLERQSQRRQRELLKQQHEAAKHGTAQLAAIEVQLFEARIEMLRSIHKESGDGWDWKAILNAVPPSEPCRRDDGERQALIAAETYRPSLTDRVMGRERAKRDELAAAVERARAEDRQLHDAAVRQHSADVQEWTHAAAVAKRVLAREPAGYIEAIRHADPFSDIADLGSEIRVSAQVPDRIEVVVVARGATVVPTEIKTLLKTGKLSTKKMSASQSNELYQDYVASCAFRVSRELFALLPVEMVIVHVVDELLNLQTGHKEQATILSVAFVRQSLEALNVDHIDPSDALKNFVHQMKFSRSKGFEAVERIAGDRL